MNTDNTAFLNNGMETLKNISKLAENISSNKNPVKQEKKEDNTNQPHNQMVEVKVGNPEENRKPMILKEKNETHIHKTFPDDRALSEAECEIEKIRLTNDHELKMKELEFRIAQETAAREDRKEREEYARKERERRQEQDKKFFRRLGWIAGGVAVVGLGCAAYDIYTSSRGIKKPGISIHKSSELHLTADEGKVE